MPKRRCCGLVEQEPFYQRFIPEGRSSALVVELRVEELEAVRLKDVKKMDQSTCAFAMGISRPTFQRILHSARSKIASALVEGKTIMIIGGSYMVKNRVFECRDCGHKWEVPPCTEGGKHGYELACPQCASMNKSKIMDNNEKHTCGGGHQHGNGGGCCGGER